MSIQPAENTNARLEWCVRRGASSEYVYERVFGFSIDFISQDFWSNNNFKRLAIWLGETTRWQNEPTHRNEHWRTDRKPLQIFGKSFVANTTYFDIHNVANFIDFQVSRQRHHAWRKKKGRRDNRLRNSSYNRQPGCCRNRAQTIFLEWSRKHVPRSTPNTSRIHHFEWILQIKYPTRLFSIRNTPDTPR